VSRLPAIITPPGHVRIVIGRLLSHPRRLGGIAGQRLRQSQVYLAIIQIIIVSQKFGEGVDVPHVILSGTAEHAPPHVVHSVFQHGLGGDPTLHPQYVFGGYASILLQYLEGFVLPGPFGAASFEVFGDAAFAVGGAAHVVFVAFALEDVHRASFEAGAEGFLEVVPSLREVGQDAEEEGGGSGGGHPPRTTFVC